MPLKNCLYFNGYKPCGRSNTCSPICGSYRPIEKKILVVHLAALGAVLRSTCLLPSILRSFPGAHITWVTEAPAHLFFKHNPMVQQVFTTSSEDLLHLRACEFDVAFAIDKSPAAAAICESVRVGERRGFAFDGLDLAVIPYNKEATELWDIGLDNLLKFEVNRKPESQLLAEALKLPYRRDDYQVFLSTGEQSNIENLHRAWSENGHYLLVGINTGCSRTIAAKKLSLSGYIQLIEKLLVRKRWRVVLLGGPEDTIRNQRLANLFPEVILTPTENGLREGLVSVGACDTIITGDSLGMHMGIALKKWVVPWFGPTCGHEIDLFDRGMAIYSAAKCSPCWRRSCHEPVMCYDQVDFSQICEAVAQGEVWHKSQIYSFKQHSLEICS